MNGIEMDDVKPTRINKNLKKKKKEVGSVGVQDLRGIEGGKYAQNTLYKVLKESRKMFKSFTLKKSIAILEVGPSSSTGCCPLLLCLPASVPAESPRS